MRRITIFIKNLFIALGVISSLMSILWALFPNNLTPLIANSPWISSVAIFVMAGLYGLFAVRKKKSIHLKLSEKVKAKVYFGDVFGSDGIVVIPVNEYFDTLVDNDVISENTLHGKFVKNYFGGDEKNLRQQITQSLKNIEPIGINESRVSGNKKQYPLGTVCEVSKGGMIFYLVALTRFNEKHRAEVKNSEYQRVICELLNYVEQRSQGRKVRIPLVGAGHSGVSLSKQKLLEFLLFSISISDNLTLINGIDVVLHPSIESEINLTLVEVLFNSIKE